MGTTTEDTIRSIATNIVSSMLNKIHTPVIDQPSIKDISRCCKVVANDLHQKFHGHWAVMIGHRAMNRKWTNVDFTFDVINNNRQHSDGTNLFEYNVNDETQNKFVYVGLGPKFYAWTVAVLNLES